MKTTSLGVEHVRLVSRGETVVSAFPAHDQRHARHDDPFIDQKADLPDAAAFAATRQTRLISYQRAVRRAPDGAAVAKPDEWESLAYIVLWLAALAALASCLGTLR